MAKNDKENGQDLHFADFAVVLYLKVVYTIRFWKLEVQSFQTSWVCLSCSKPHWEQIKNNQK